MSNVADARNEDLLTATTGDAGTPFTANGVPDGEDPTSPTQADSGASIDFPEEERDVLDSGRNLDDLLPKLSFPPSSAVHLS